MVNRDNRRAAGRVARVLACLVAATAVPGAVHAQSFTLFDRSVQIHGFASQAFFESEGNNFLTMSTRDGAGNFFDAGVNVSSQLSRKLRAGGQFYVRNVGEMGNFRLEIDWALADYRVTDWFGLRVGKNKKVLGLYNDTQDMVFLHTWAILPQSLYPVDLRASTMAHTGVDVYGTVSLKRAGSMSYTAYRGLRPEDPEGGFAYGLAVTRGLIFDSYGGRQSGADLRWSPPINGLLVGASLMYQDVVGKGTRPSGNTRIPNREESLKDETVQYYGQYQRGRTKIDVEHRRYIRKQDVVTINRIIYSDARGFYVAGAQRLSKYVEVGGYFSNFVSKWQLNHELPDNHIYDRSLTGRFDIMRGLNVKLEYHFMDGYGAFDSIRGFYAPTNPQGLQPKTKLLIVRTGFDF